MTDQPAPSSLLAQALDQTGVVLDHVHADHLGRPTPCGEWDVSALGRHLLASPRNFLAMLQGDEPDWDATEPAPALPWGPEFRVRADDLLHAWHRTGDQPPVPVGIVVAEMAVHSWDLARATGFPVDRLDPGIAAAGLEFLRDNLTPERRGEAFGPERPAPAGAGPYEALAAYAGREV